ncbi:uncharacterized protein B0I36DRAFT_31201 [Microdochium trichocladiopsis]|uniref:Uncharacterized protein n=1 Tax=Microdochium trichocladiopsis TaxID=1682393 RepID=A0A9P8XW78_9PEZI|nr:uncharacterized protein B0I36DRAFT_31201 [Microdochium trichocladiopsis]KAH7021318.1 hypothetical protein B0I36DRAFT_31201 [Microdochium trichocladiopsis]
MRSPGNTRRQQRHVGSTDPMTSSPKCCGAEQCTGRPSLGCSSVSCARGRAHSSPNRRAGGARGRACLSVLLVRCCRTHVRLILAKHQIPISRVDRSTAPTQKGSAMVRPGTCSESQHPSLMVRAAPIPMPCHRALLTQSTIPSCFGGLLLLAVVCPGRWSTTRYRATLLTFLFLILGNPG